MKDTQIRTLLPDAKEKKFTKGEFIFKEGDNNPNFYFILNGRVEIIKKTSGGQDKVIAQLENGDFLGEGILSGNEKKPASAVALGEVTLLVLGYTEFQSYIKQDPARMTQFLLRVLDSTSDRLTDTNSKLLAIYELNQIISLYRDDLKNLALHLVENLNTLTDSQEGVFLVRNPFSDTYRLIYSNQATFDLSKFDQSLLKTTKVTDWHGQLVLILAIEDQGAILLLGAGQYDEDQVRILSLMSEQIAVALKDASRRAADKAKRILQTKHFDL